MHAVFIVAIVFGSVVTLAGLLCGTILVIVRMRQSTSGQAKQGSQDEGMMVQEIYRGLEKMEQRIEALETILMDGHDTHGDKR
ncbi:MAG: phage-shock protein [Desulfocapsaceae bacterium]